ncbi:MAG: YjbQ family protein [Anaerolineae bacterium]|nr:YjbQ family protein [Anaerolineae bacterium]
MIIRTVTLTVQSRREQELIDVTPEVQRVIEESGVQEGLVNVLTMHTSSGIVVTEGLPCLEEDVVNHLSRLCPSEGNYLHRRYLDIDGRIGFNADAHLKSVLGGISATFPITGGKILKGGRQTIYFAEYDGPLSREYVVQVLGE